MQQRQKLSDQVFDRLWAMVQSGELSPGDAMPSERALMERFNVGRPAVREALQTMANKGLITIAHGERSRVNKLTPGIAFGQVDDIAKLLLSTEPSNLEKLKQIRKILEAGSIEINTSASSALEATYEHKLTRTPKRRIDRHWHCAEHPRVLSQLAWAK